jgi:hypothetical protein
MACAHAAVACCWAAGRKTAEHGCSPGTPAVAHDGGRRCFSSSPICLPAAAAHSGSHIAMRRIAASAAYRCSTLGAALLRGMPHACDNARAAPPRASLARALPPARTPACCIVAHARYAPKTCGALVLSVQAMDTRCHHSRVTLRRWKHSADSSGCQRAEAARSDAAAQQGASQRSKRAASEGHKCSERPATAAPLTSSSASRCRCCDVAPHARGAPARALRAERADQRLRLQPHAC